MSRLGTRSQPVRTMTALILPRWVPFLVVSFFALVGAVMLQEASESATLFPGGRPEHTPGTSPASLHRGNVATRPVEGTGGTRPEQAQLGPVPADTRARTAVSNEAMRDEAQRDEDRRRAIEETRRREALLVARRRVNVTMYATTWCSVCERARHYMDSQGISFVEHDVERNRTAEVRYRELNPRGGVPTLDVDGAVLVGFTPQTLERAVDTAAKARLASIE